jgi:hypothetical protein
LGKYCQRWHLDINIEKTKVVHFQNGTKLPKRKFYINKKEIEISKSYMYLGTMFTQNGNFTAAVDHLYQKASKAWFSLSSSLFNSDFQDASLMLKLFDTMIRPITTYACEVWAQQFTNKLDLEKNNLDRLPFEQLQNRVCKSILGVRKCTTNLACRAELGRFPLLLFICKRALAYLAKLRNMGENRLAYKALKSEEELNDQGINSWKTFIMKLCRIFNIESDDIIDENFIVSQLEAKYTAFFLRKVKTTNETGPGNKLRTYALFKNGI